jgi:hypothetical protein
VVEDVPQVVVRDVGAARDDDPSGGEDPRVRVEPPGAVLRDERDAVPGLHPHLPEAPQTPSQFAVRAVPTIVFFKGGKAVDTVVGLRKESELRDRIERLIKQ